jgi:hypothetical protein
VGGVLLDQKRGNKCTVALLDESTVRYYWAVGIRSMNLGYCTVALLDKDKVTYLGGENMLYEVVRRGTACWTREVDGDEWGLQRPYWMRKRLRCWAGENTLDEVDATAGPTQREVDRDEWGAQWPCWMRTRLRFYWKVGIRCTK